MTRCKTKIEFENEVYACNQDAGDNEFCILHDPNPNKDKEDFLRNIKSKINDPDNPRYDLRGTIFPVFNGIFSNEIPKHLILDGAIFKCDVDFTRSEFRTTVSFRKVIFEKDCRFDSSVIRAESYWDDSKFYGLSSFKDVEFARTGNFSGVSFFGKSSFENCRYPKDYCIFKNVSFHDEAILKGTNFNGGLKLMSSHFFGPADFSKSRINGSLHLTNVDFEKSSLFEEIFVDGGVIFERVAFNDNVYFAKATFPHGLFCYNSTFNSDADFKMTNFCNQKLLFRNCRLFGLNVSQLPFLDNIVSFEKCTWPQQGFLFFKGRCRINDEISLSGLTDLTNLYRKLHKYYYDKSEFDIASDFYVGFQISNRKTKKSKLIQKFISLFYSFFSKYGESILRPLFGLLIMWAIVPIILLHLGIRLDPNIKSPTVIKLSFSGDFIPLFPEYWKAVAYNISLSTLFRASELRPSITSWQQVILLIETLLNGLLVSFIALGIRRLFVPKKPG